MGRVVGPPHTTFRGEQATPDNITFAGDIDGYAITGRAERTDDQVNVIIVPQVLGVGMAKKRIMFLVRKHGTGSVVGEASGATMANPQPQSSGTQNPQAQFGGEAPVDQVESSSVDPAGPPPDEISDEEYELAPVRRGDCICCGGTPAGTAACNEDDSINCGMQNPCAGGGYCDWTPRGGSPLYAFACVCLLLLVSRSGKLPC